MGKMIEYIKKFLSPVFRLLNRLLTNIDNERINALKAAKIGFWEYDPLSENIIWSEGVYDIFEIEDLSLPLNRTKLLSFLPDDDKKLFLKVFSESISFKKDYSFEYRILSGKNNIKFIEERGRHYYDDSGNYIKSTGIVYDITLRVKEQKKDEERLSGLLGEIEKDKIKYKTLMENSSDAIFIADWDGFIVEYSNQFKELLGYNDKEISKLHVLDFEVAYSEKQIKTNIEKNIRYKPFAFESRFKRKDGILVDVSINIVKVKLDSIEYFYCSCRDISNIKEYEKELIERQSKLELAKNTASLGIWELDLITDELKGDDKSHEIFEISRDEFDGRNSTWEKMVDSTDRLRLKREIGEAILSDKPYNTVYKVNLKNGSFKYIKATGTIIRDPQNKPVKMLGTVVDITERKISSDKIKEQKEEFEAIFRNSKDGIAIVDLESKFLDCNDAYLDMLGYTKKELFTKSCIDLTVPQERENSILALEEGLKYGYLKNYEKTCLTKRGRRIKINMTASMLPDKKRFLMITKDITALKLLEEQSKLASMGEMIGNISHQWRQPLNLMTTSAGAVDIKRELGELKEEDIAGFIKTVIEQSKYLSKTIDDFKNFIKGDEKFVPVSIKGVIDAVLNLMGAVMANNYINLVLSIEDDILIMGNKNELEQAFINILNNAKDALKENVADEDERFIFISTKRFDEETLELKILDSGGGIEEDIIGKVFEPYFTTKEQSAGTGLGLSMGYKIITQRHKQTIDVFNEEFEYNNKHFKGACFLLDIQKRKLVL